ncbi:MAG: hypothetical protein P4L90_26505 [Rhodopila sp.]|nr:hypothetical protein [Rhodopila sp.]
MVLTRRLLISILIAAGVSGCGPSYSPDTYASNAAQQANKVEQGVIVGVRTVAVSASGTIGAVTGGAAGGIAGSQVGVGPASAFAALGGSLVGGIAGTTVEHVTADTTAFEYIVRKPNGDLVSVTQKDKTPLALGQKVLVIAGTQARIIPDYTVPPASIAKADKAAEPPKPAEPVKADAASPEAKPADTASAEAGSSKSDDKPAEPVETKPAASAPAASPLADSAPAAAPPAKPDSKPAASADTGKPAAAANP